MLVVLSLFFAAIPVTPPATPTPSDNAYTVLRDALAAASNGDVIELFGHFDFTEPNARDSWAAGEYLIDVPDGLSNVTLTAAALGDAVISGPGDVATEGYDLFLYFVEGRTNPGWTISNLRIENFDTGIYFGRSSAPGFNDTIIENNEFIIPSDVPGNGNADPSLNPEMTQNLGLILGFGTHQKVRNNRFEIDGTGASGSDEQAKIYALQTQNSTNDQYDGLEITGNTFVVKGAPDANPARIYGILENSGDVHSNMLIESNHFESETPFSVKANAQIAFLPTTHSNVAESKQATWRDNWALGTYRGFGLFDRYPTIVFYAPDPVVLELNRCVGADTCIYVPLHGRLSISTTTVLGGRLGIHSDTGTVNAQNNRFSGQAEAAIKLTGDAHLTANGNMFHDQQGFVIDNQVLLADDASHDATANYWDDPDPVAIEAVVFHQADTLTAPISGFVDFTSPLQTVAPASLSVAKLPMVVIPFTGGVIIESVPRYGTLSTTGGPLRVGDSAILEVTYTRSASAADSFYFSSATATTAASLVTLTNAAPTLSGSPATEVEAGAAYAFTPVVGDANMDVLTFTATGLPSWLTLDPATGALSGTAPDSGTTDAIVISASDGSLSGALASFTVTVSAAAAMGMTGETGMTGSTAATGDSGVTGPTDIETGDAEALNPDDMSARGSGCRCNSARTDDGWMLFALLAAIRWRRRRC